MSPHESPRYRSKPPPDTLLEKRLQLLKAGACYAELALLTGTWHPASMETVIENKGAIGRKNMGRMMRGTGKYLRYQQGAVPRSETFVIVDKKYPANALRYWKHHPLGTLLLRPRLSHIEIQQALELLPHGPARKLMWFERGGSRLEVPYSEDLLNELVALESEGALIVLLGRIRLRLLMGQTEEIELLEHAVLDCFPEVVGRDTHLSVARNPLMQALSDFLNWISLWFEPNSALMKNPDDTRTRKIWTNYWSRLHEAAAEVPVEQRPEPNHISLIEQQNGILESEFDPSVKL